MIDKALVLHYITSLPYYHIFFPLKEIQFQKNIRINGLSENLKTYILNPKDFIYITWNFK